MPLPDLDKAVGHSFGLQINGGSVMRIQEVSGLKMEQDVIELTEKSANGTPVVRRLPGRPKAGEITLTRNLTDDTSFEKWIKEIRVGRASDARKNGAIIIFDSAGSAVKRFKLTHCWPKSLEIGIAQVSDTTVLTEKLVITYESLDLE